MMLLCLLLLTADTQPTGLGQLQQTVDVQGAGHPTYTQPLTIPVPGPVRVRWMPRQDRAQHSLTLYGPARPARVNPDAWYARRDGFGPLELDYDVKLADLAGGEAWRVEVTCWNRPRLEGLLWVSWPEGPSAAPWVAQGTLREHVPVQTPRQDNPQAEYAFTVRCTGRIEIVWTPGDPAQRCTLLLHGPDRPGAVNPQAAYAVAEGAGPLRLTYDVRRADLAAGTQWRARVRQYGRLKTLVGALDVTWPRCVRADPQGRTDAVRSERPVDIRGQINPTYVYAFELKAPGPIHLQWATSVPTAWPAELLLLGPWRPTAADPQTPYARQAGPAPLHLTYQATAEDAQRPGPWKAVVRQFSRLEPMRGTLVVIYPRRGE